MTKPKPKLTRELLHESLKPPNNCKVRSFMDQLDPESREVFTEALAYDSRDYPASAVRRFLVDCGFAEEDIPGDSAIQDHRNGRRPCRCKG